MTSNSTDEDSYDSSSGSENDHSSVKKEYRKCKFCGKQSPSAAKSKMHEANCEHIRNVEICVLANGKTKFLCKICNQTFKYITGLTRHEKRHEPPGGFICRLCNSAFTTDAERNTHKEQTHRLYKCQICEEHFTEDQSYIDHIQNVHDGKDREYVICTVCGQTFRTSAQLKNHNDSKCGTEKSFGCDVCDSKFMTQNTLNAHKLIHSGEKKHLCNYCGNSFLSKGQLKVHERSHTHEKPFKCEVCGKAFSYRESLVTHSSLHTGIKPYFCECCSSRFSCIGNLIKHRKARPDSCGQPQYCKNSKIAPRASAKNPGSLTMKIPKTMPKTARGPYKKKKPEEIFAIHEIKTENNSVVADEIIISDSKNTPDKSFIIDYIEEKIIEETKSIKTDSEIPQATTDEQFQEFSQTEYVTQPVFNYVPATNDAYNWNQTETIVYEPQENSYENNPFDDADDEIYSNDDEKPTNDNSDNFITAELVNVKMETDNEEGGECSPNVKLKNLNKNSDKKMKRRGSRSNDKRGKENSSDEEDDYRKVVYQYESTISQKPIRNRKRIQQTNSSESEGADEIDLENDPDFVPITTKRISPKKSRDDENLSEEEDMDEKHFNDIIYFDNGEDDLLTVQYAAKEGDEEVDANSTEDFFECSMCPKRYKHKSGVHKHIRSEHATDDTKKPVKKDKAQFQCKFCNKKYLSLLLLEKHQRVHGSDGTLINKCSCCKLYFATILEVEAHQLKEHEDKLVCSVCHKAFKEPDNLQAHFRYAHNKGVPSPKKYMYMCPSCGKNFSSKVALSDHERSNCGRSPLYKCEYCEKAFHSAGSLKTHQTVHTGELPHLCNYCGKAFRTVGQVKVHERRHNGDKPFKCEYCPKAFGYRESLLTHRSLHTGMKRFMCHACGSRFSCISNLQAHRKSHKNTCGLQPNYTKSVGPMGALEMEASATATSTETGFVPD